MAASRPQAMSMTRKVRLIRLRPSAGTLFEMLDKPTTVMGAGSHSILKERMAFRVSGPCS